MKTQKTISWRQFKDIILKKCIACGTQYSEEWVRYCPLDGNELETANDAGSANEMKGPSSYSMDISSLGPTHDPIWSEFTDTVLLATGQEAEHVTFKELFTNNEQVGLGNFRSENGFFHFKVEYNLGSVNLVIQCPSLELQKHQTLFKI